MEVVAPQLLTLTRHRGNIPVMAALARSGRGFNELALGLDLSRDTLNRSLKALQMPKWVSRFAAGPHWRVTKPGARIAPVCAGILEISDVLNQREMLMHRWSLPVAAALENWSLHFGELRTMLPGITPRALTMTLKEMQGAGLVHREVVMQFPPSTVYRLTDKGEKFLPLLRKIG